MRELLCKLFGIYREESSQAIRFARLALFWALGSACLETLSDALFLEKIGASELPKVYLSIACCMIVLSSIVLWRLRSSSPYKILVTTLFLASLFSLSASYVFTFFPSTEFWYFLKIGSKIFFSVLIAISWTFADQYHDLQEAKRVYSLYSAAYFMGTVCSGLAINLLLDRIGYSGLFILSSFAFGLSLFEARKISVKTQAVADDTTEGVFSGSRDSFGKVAGLIFRSPFALVLLSLSLFTQLLITVTEFNYMETFGTQLQSMGEGVIAEFLGKWRAGISLCNILVGLFLYGRMVRKSGLPNVILITPLFFSGVYSGWMTSDTLLFAILGLIAVDGILFTIEDNCFNLLSNGVPSQLKSRVRIINDSFFEPIGMLLSALLLFSFESWSKWIGATLTAVMLLLTLFLRSI
jgi:ATP/ADP translocase